MRQANRTFGHAKLPRHISGSRQLHPPRPQHGWVGGSAYAVVGQNITRYFPSRKFATAAATHSELIASGNISPSLPHLKSRAKQPAETYKREGEPVGKWNWLAGDNQRLAIETDFNRKGPAAQWRPSLLVDHLDNHGDLQLWSCLVSYLHRVHGDSGVRKLWDALWGRKSLYEIKSLPTRTFWQTVLEAALRSSDDKFLDGVFIYAEWMREIHATKWPDLYVTIVSYFLRTHQHNKAVQWHLRLSPNFYPGSGDFACIIREFSTDAALTSAFTLQSLYITSPEKGLYDMLVPYLYSQGQSRLARLWRTICVRYDDGPLLHVPTRPFLRHFIAYWPGNHYPLHPKEAIAIGEHDSGSPEEEEEQQLEVSREFVNRIHGKTFGFSAQTYNDRLGSRWFASSWVSLDTAISIIAALGIQEIGPLSLQSISLREGTSDGILARISQLQGVGISVPDSGYANTIQYFARIRDEELLADILHCDIHPDIFDDVQLQIRLIESSASSGDWRTYRLLLASRLAFVEKTMQIAANTLLEMHLIQEDPRGILRVLDEMRATQVGVNVKQTNIMFAFILEHLKWHKRELTPPRDLEFCLALCRRLSSMDVPVPVICWKKILYCLGRHGNLDEFHRLVLELVDYYTIRQSARPGFVPVHINDLPDALVRPLKGVKNLIGLYIPLDTKPSMPMHPLNQLFKPKLQGDLIRWSFRKIHSPLERTALIGQGKGAIPTTYFGRAVDLLRQLRRVGMNIDLPTVRKAVLIRLADLYGTALPIKNIEHAGRRTNVLSLSQMRALCNEGWGDDWGNPLLPPLQELEREIERFDANRWKRNQVYAKSFDREQWKPK